MTRDEWETIALLIENCWRGEFDDTRSASYYTLLRSFEHGEVMAALHVLAEQGKPFVPSVPEIVQAVRAAQEPSTPSFSEVWSVLQRAMRLRLDDDSVAVMEEHCGPVAAAFVKAEGVARLKHIEFWNPDHGELRIKELERRWTDFADRAGQRARLGLALQASGRRESGLGRMKTSALVPGSDEVNNDQEGTQ
ncbi:MAG: hypothetical protein EBR82_49345 [Caulobacteraceae bacterium]|nr:hypothetical protein [Caulobacteraceae bacterium]